ncbi:thiol-disulfide oxidoreductase DCC family protein [Pedobacter cryophilus]|uniref:Thiol-disulfide oxidoreductase DCC family protein n=1 Tax=Pedobacter cryophilus TaxID=2571271 RepID=A0A4U1C869_9SPHI|nr:thiol-disulfide oxidoreductase DCC family protein [Pedobacter cryophilus]TKC00617.1 thiol-disulfide oxidoreductase DCC family protein [Pedobacter cryophilus]
MQQFVILFDGVCNLCNGFVQFVIKRDPQAQFKFADLQSDAAKALLSAHNIQIKDLKTVIFIANNKVYTQSDAALQIAKYLGGAWPLARVLLVVPKFIRNGIYSFIAKNRYRWFGKTEQCMVPNSNLKSRFL